MASLIHLSLPNLRLLHDFPFQEFSPRPCRFFSTLRVYQVEVRQHWQGIVFPHVEYLETDRSYDELDEIPIEFWREFLLNVNEVASRYVFFLDSFLPKSMLIFLFFALRFQMTVRRGHRLLGGLVSEAYPLVEWTGSTWLSHNLFVPFSSCSFATSSKLATSTTGSCFYYRQLCLIKKQSLEQ